MLRPKLRPLRLSRQRCQPLANVTNRSYTLSRLRGCFTYLFQQLLIALPLAWERYLVTGKNRRSRSPTQAPQRHIDPSTWEPLAPPVEPLLAVIDPLAVDRPVVRVSEDRARRGVGPGHFLRFNGRNTQTSGLPGLRPVAPSLRSGYGRPPHGGRWCAARTVTRATPGTCSVLDRRPRSATSKAQAGPRRRPLYARRACAGGTRRCALTNTPSRRRTPDGVPSVRRHSRQGSSGRLRGRDHP